jgi:hypothetical protein
MTYTICSLDASNLGTCFAELVERNNGVYGVECPICYTVSIVEIPHV